MFVHVQLLYRINWWSLTACCPWKPWWNPRLRSQLCLCCLSCLHIRQTMYEQTVHRRRSTKVNINVSKPTLIWPSFNSQFILVSEGILEEIALLLHHNRSSSLIVAHCCEIMASLCSSSIGQQVQRSSNANFNACLCVQLMLDLCVHNTQDRETL